ncbi:DUF6538 domain-containing protein [Roseobacter sp. GAI101]|uniref:DUF6538 domain-containing protein n=1 Tax=Roseobacter sp. (strain GAI101) TaxID=391589 RepID=UPI00018716FB|nr:DUF6538 domain-containing protein [Roseobacter sp. GAI101]EEB84905.1 phage integrase [Roseobacter sp. GAI101]
MSVIKRGNQWCLRRRVPVEFQQVESRSEVWISLKTDSRRLACEKAPAVWNEQVAAWKARLSGHDDDAVKHFEAVQDLAAAKGVRYMPLDQVVQLPINTLLERIETIANRDQRPDLVEAAAVLGAKQPPALTVTQALETYWTLAKDKTFGKSEDQKRRWENPRKKAVRNFVSVVGDKPMNHITADDMLEFRGYWQERIEIGGLTANSANKDLIHLGDILKTVNSMKRLGFVLPLDGLAFKEGEKSERPPFSDDWIRTKLLAPNALMGLDPEARAIFLGMVNTGYRPSEAACAAPDQFCLDADIPHLIIRSRPGRAIKNKNSKRVIPLVGVSLEVMRAFPNGFPTFRDNDAGLSSTVNKYLRANGLMESDDHVVYSLRHSFEDRLLRAGVDDRVRRDLMGHSLNRERYGQGGGLAFKAEMVQRIAF